MPKIRQSLEPLTDTQLVEQVPVDGPDDRIWQQAPYLLEMQRRQIVAIRDFNRQSSRQSNIMIWLTVVIALLTVAIAYLTFVMARQAGA
jgi:hypothetical protein